MTLPRIQQIRPTWRKDPFDHPDWLFDLKYDGFRALAVIQPGRTQLVSRNGNSFASFADLSEAISSHLGTDAKTVLDGEIACVRIGVADLGSKTCFSAVAPPVSMLLIY